MDPRNKSSQELAQERAKQLRERITDYLEAEKSIVTGFRAEEQIRENQARIKKLLHATEEQWQDWRWQMRNRIKSVEVLREIIRLSDGEAEAIERVGKQYRWSISPYYASLIDPEDPRDPIKLMSVPSALEEVPVGQLDPMAEEYTSPVPGVTRRYPDRLIIKVTNQCAMYCRHCQRRRLIGEQDTHMTKEDLARALQYVKDNPEIRDVLLTGGDALMLSDETLDWLLGELRGIEHVEIIRLGSRTPVTLPQRITPQLCEIIGKYHPVFLNTHFNHPKEITREAATACDRLSRQGIPLGNQAVLLNGVNNDVHVMKKLCHELLRIRVRPYYIFHAKHVRGTTHFRCKVETGFEIMEKLRGYTSGMAIPTYIVNAPGGYGKTPILPNYVVSWGKNHVLIRTWEGHLIEYPNYEGELPFEEENNDSYH